MRGGAIPNVFVIAVIPWLEKSGFLLACQREVTLEYALDLPQSSTDPESLTGMPLPTPIAEESREEFVARFMASEKARAEFPDRDQRLAVAFQKWGDKKKVGMKKSLKRILDARITRIALCKEGKNGFKTLFKSDGSIEINTLVKSQSEGELLAVVYAPNRPDFDDEFAEPHVVKAMAHEFLRDHRELDIEHEGEALDNEDAYVAESFIIAKGDERFSNWKRYDGEPAGDLTGSWAVKIQIDNPELRKAYANGGWDGVSMFGHAAVEHVDVVAASKRVAGRLGGGEKHMDKTELKAALDAFMSEVRAEIAKAVKPSEKPADDDKDQPEEMQAPEFEGDVDNPEDLQKFEKSLRTFELRKALKAGKVTAAQIAEMRKNVQEIQPSDTEVGIEAKDSPEVRELKRRLHKAQKRTNAPERKGEPEGTEVELAKANRDEGLEIGKLLNGDSSFGTMRVVKSV